MIIKKAIAVGDLFPLTVTVSLWEYLFGKVRGVGTYHCKGANTLKKALNKAGIKHQCARWWIEIGEFYDEDASHRYIIKSDKSIDKISLFNRKLTLSINEIRRY